MNCPGSVRLQPAERKPSRAAAEGTFAHDIAALTLTKGTPSARTYIGFAGTVEGFDFICDEEMADAIDVYVAAVRGWSGVAAETLVEVKLTKKLRTIDPDLGGTGDYVAYRPADKHLLVADFKYGAGTFVAEEDNRQLKIYALGALLTIGRPVEKVTVMIVQPRYEGAEPVRAWTFEAFDLLEFQADLKAAATKTREKDAPAVAGTWCRKTFCAAARTCPATEAEQHALIARQFDAVVPYDADALAKALAMIPVVKERIKQIEEFAYAQATAGAKIPGYKLVDKVARRQWTADEATIAEWAEARGVEPYERSLKSPAQIEKGLQKNEKPQLAELCAAVSSGTTLVPEADRRPAVSAMVTVEDFSAVDGAEKKQDPRLNLFTS